MSYKIIHTADWHLGRKFHDLDLLPYQSMFFDWLLEIIKKEKADLLLVSGDVFDLANPSQESQRLYYQFLSTLSQTSCRAIITAGNHDAPGLIDAPSGILEALKIQVVGVIPEEKEKLIFPLLDKSGKCWGAIAAIPFLRDRDVKNAISGETYESRVEAVRNGMLVYYQEIKETMKKLYPETLHLAMGHLFTAQASSSDTERDIQVGNQALFPLEIFENNFDYVALGHIHKAQKLGKQDNIRYSGSPLPMSFSEKDYLHQIVIAEIDEGGLQHKEILVPRSFHLLTFEGSLEEIQSKCTELKSFEDQKNWISLSIHEKNYDPVYFTKMEELITDIETNGNCKVLQRRIYFENNASNRVSPEVMGDHETLSPEFIYSEMISQRDENEKSKLMEMLFDIKQEAETSEI